MILEKVQEKLIDLLQKKVVTKHIADVPSKSKSDLEDAEQELFKDDDSIPVKM